MTHCLTSAILVDFDPIRVEQGALRLANGNIQARGANVAPQSGDTVINCGGAVVMPGLVNGHTHLYSALAVGMPPPREAPRNFMEILQRVWWRLDQALDADSIETSAVIGAFAAARCGTTTLIDHHASPRCIEGSLDRVESGIASVGLRGVLCYETTDRHGGDGTKAGLAENERYLAKVRAGGDGRFAGLVGAHASFTMDDHSLFMSGELCRKYDAGVHIHVAEDPCDEADCRRKHHCSLIERLSRSNLLTPKSVFAHCTNLPPDDILRIQETGATVAHNARSNMNNGVGYAPVAELSNFMMLGTDGIGGDMFAEARASWLIARHEHADVSPGEIVKMLARSARRASTSLGVTLGKLEPGAAADVIVTDYVPSTPLTSENAAGHLLFGLHAGHVRHVFVSGRPVVQDRRIVGVDEAEVSRTAARVSAALWRRMESIP